MNACSFKINCIHERMETGNKTNLFEALAELEKLYPHINGFHGYWMDKPVGDGSCCNHHVFDHYNLPDDECSVYSEPKVIYILNRMTSSEVCEHIPLDVFNYMYGLLTRINKQMDEIEELKWPEQLEHNRVTEEYLDTYMDGRRSLREHLCIPEILVGASEEVNNTAK